MPDIALTKIISNSLNPRLQLEESALEELIASIREVGVLEPIVVRPFKNSYQIVVGERRYRAAMKAGLQEIPVIIRDYSDDEVIQVNLIENVQRDELSVVEKAKACQYLRNNFPNQYPNWQILAKKVGISKSTLENWIRTLQFPEEIQQQIAPKNAVKVPEGKIDYDTAMSIVRSVKGSERQTMVAKEFANRRISFQDRRKVLREYAKEPEKPIQHVIREVVEEAPALLPFSREHAELIVHKIKTQTSRKGVDPKIKQGKTARVAITYYADVEINSIQRKKLGDFDNGDAKREGGYSLEEFKAVWEKIHGNWNPNESVSVIRFSLLKEAPKLDNKEG